MNLERFIMRQLTIIFSHVYIIIIIHLYVQGIGQGRVTDNLNGAPVDSALFIPDSDVVAMVHKSAYNIYTY